MFTRFTSLPGDMIMTLQAQPLYCDMQLLQKPLNWLDPGLHLVLAPITSLLTSAIAFQPSDFDLQTLATFGGYYIILGGMALIYRFRKILTNPQTRQLIHFSFFLLGFVLMVTGLLGMMTAGIKMGVVVLLVLFLPGLVNLRAGLHFKKQGG